MTICQCFRDIRTLCADTRHGCGGVPRVQRAAGGQGDDDDDAGSRHGLRAARGEDIVNNVFNVDIV